MTEIVTARFVLLEDVRRGVSSGMFNRLSSFQDAFSLHRDTVVGEGYTWPKRPLFEWSRRAEYPLVAELIQEGRGKTLLDAGSGVTFYSIFLQDKLGYQVTCLDTEAEYGKYYNHICELMNMNPPVDYIQCDLEKEYMPITKYYDVVISISVIEHLDVNYRKHALSLLWSAIKSGGLLVLTVDVPMNDEMSPNVDELNALLDDISQVVGIKVNIAVDDMSKVLSTYRPGYRIAPLVFGKSDLSGVLAAARFRWRHKSLPMSPLSCVAIALRK